MRPPDRSTANIAASTARFIGRRTLVKHEAGHDGVRRLHANVSTNVSPMPTRHCHRCAAGRFMPGNREHVTVRGRLR